MKPKHLISAFAIATIASTANAGIISFTVEDGGQLSSTQADVTEVNFNDGTIGSYTEGVEKQYAIYDSSRHGSAQPYLVSDKFLSVPNPDRNGSATFNLDDDYNYFGLYWGSVDTYNHVEFFLGGTSVGTFSGGDIAPPLVADGNQGNHASNRYVNFFFDGATFDSITLTSNGYAFESDNHAYGNVSVPEPGSLALLGLGLAGLAYSRRKS